MPASATEEIEEATIKLGVEAVQGNAAVYDAEVSTEEDLVAALASEEPNVSVKLTQDITLNSYLKTKGNTTIYGDGNTKITASSGATSRVINIDSDEVPANKTDSATLKLVGLNLVGKAENTNSKDRCISVWGNKDLTIELENCVATCGHYALYVAAENEKVNIVARNSTFKGYSALDLYSPNVTATFENCTLIGQNDFANSDSNGYETIGIDNEASNATLNFNNCRIEANQTTGNRQSFFGIYTSTAKINVVNSSFWINGVESIGKDNVSANIYGYSNCVTIDGEKLA